MKLVGGKETHLSYLVKARKKVQVKDKLEGDNYHTWLLGKDGE